MIRSLLKTPGRLFWGQAGRWTLLIWFSAKDAVAALIKRLAHRNANVQLYTLEVRFLYGDLWEAVGANSPG